MVNQPPLLPASAPDRRHPVLLPLGIIGGWVVLGAGWFSAAWIYDVIESGCEGCPYSLLALMFFLSFFGLLLLPALIGSAFVVLVLQLAGRRLRWLQLAVALAAPPLGAYAILSWIGDF